MIRKRIQSLVAQMTGRDLLSIYFFTQWYFNSKKMPAGVGAPTSSKEIYIPELYQEGD